MTTATAARERVGKLAAEIMALLDEWTARRTDWPVVAFCIDRRLSGIGIAIRQDRPGSLRAYHGVRCEKLSPGDAEAVATVLRQVMAGRNVPEAVGGFE